MAMLMVFSVTTVSAQYRSDCAADTNMFIGINGTWTDDWTDALAGSLTNVPISAEVKVGSNPYIDQAVISSFSIAVSNDAGEPSITIDNSNIGSYGDAWQPTIPAAFFTAGAVVTVAMTVDPDDTSAPKGCTQPWTYTWTLTTATGCVPVVAEAIAPNYSPDSGTTWFNAEENTTPGQIDVLSTDGTITFGPWPTDGIYTWEWTGACAGSLSDPAVREPVFTIGTESCALTATATRDDGCGGTVMSSYTFNIIVDGKPLGVEKFEQAGFSMYPNPAKDNLIINFNGNLDITILNTSGQKIMSRSINGQETIDVSRLSRGLYFVKIAADKDVMTRKFIKE